MVGSWTSRRSTGGSSRPVRTSPLGDASSYGRPEASRNTSLRWYVQSPRHARGVLVWAKTGDTDEVRATFGREGPGTAHAVSRHVVDAHSAHVPTHHAPHPPPPAAARARE